MARTSKTSPSGGIITWAKVKLAATDLRRALLKLPATGSNGFEGLLAVILTKMAGHTFRLAGSGSQHGKDGESLSSTNHIAFEGKLYNGYIHKDVVLAKLAELIGSEKSPDLWLLGATVEIKPQITTPLFSAAHKNAITVIVLDWAKASPVPALAAACAAAMDETASFLAANIADAKAASKAKAALKAIAAHPSFKAQADEITRELREPSLGVPAATAANRAWLSAAFSDRKQARSRFGQPLAPIAPHPFVVLPRDKLSSAIDTRVFGAPSKEVIALLGDEGCGKSWIFAQSWLRSNKRPLTLVIGAADLNAVVAYAAIEPFLIGRLIHQTGDVDNELNRRRWQRRFQLWKRDTDRASPKLVLFVDGLNQHPEFEWARWLDGTSTLLDEIGGVLVISARNGYFKDRLKTALTSPTREIQVPEWSADELTEILRSKGVEIEKLSSQVAKTLRNPRLLAIALTLLDTKAIQSLSELSVPRLLFEQVRSSEREGHAGEPVEQFKKRLSDHAREIIERIKEQQHADKQIFEVASGSSPHRHELSLALLAVTEGRFFKPLPEDPMRYELLDDGLDVALGLSIMRTLQFAERNKQDVTEALDDILEPISALDRTAEIVFGALQVAGADDRCSLEIRKTLICAFLRLQHVDVEIYPAFCLVVRNAVGAAMSALADIASSSRYTPSKGWLLSALREQRDDPASWAEMSKHIDRWLRYYSLSPELALLSSRKTDGAAVVDKEIAKNLERVDATLKELTQEEAEFIRRHLVREDNRDPGILSSDAFVLLSGMPLADFAQSLVACSLSRSLNASLRSAPDDFLALIRLNRRDWKATRSQLLNAASFLDTAGASRAAKWALVKILAATCTREDAEREEILVDNLTKDRPRPEGWRLVEDYCETDPCNPNSPSPKNVALTAARYSAVDLTHIRSSMGHTAEDHFLSMALPGLARFQPAEAIATHRKLADEILTRSEEALRLGIQSLEPDTAIFEPHTVQRLIQTARSLSEPVVKEDEASRRKWVNSQYSLLLALPHLSGDDQLQQLADIPTPGPALLKLIDTLKPADPAKLEAAVSAAITPFDHGKLMLMLTFARYSTTPITMPVRDAVLSLSQSSDASVRAQALNLIAHLKDNELTTAIAQSAWSAEPLNPRENHFEIWYGSEILIEAGRIGVLKPEQVIDRITPRLFARAAVVLGGDVQQLIADRINASIARSLTVELPSPPPAVEQTTEAKLPGVPPLLSLAYVAEGVGAQEFFKRLSEANEEFHARQIKGWAAFNQFDATISKEKARLIVEDVGGASIGCCVSADREVAVKWANHFLGLSDRNLKRIHNVALLLAEKLSPFEPLLARRLFEHLRTKSAFVSLKYGYAGVTLEAKCVWRSAQHAELDLLRKRRLDAASVDAELAAEVVAALTYGRSEFLDNYVTEGLASDEPAKNARAMMVLGFGLKSARAESVFNEFASAKGFLATAAKAAREAYERNVWSEHWLKLMRAASTPEDFWRYSKLLLKIVDARFELWERGVPGNEGPARAFEHSIEANLVKRIDAWKTKREKTLFGQKAPVDVYTVLP